MGRRHRSPRTVGRTERSRSRCSGPVNTTTRKNQRIVQLTQEAYLDAEKRLDYSPIIKPNDAPEVDPTVRAAFTESSGERCGTRSTTRSSGAFGDWINNPIGLNADGIDNEMSLSHLSTCGIGTCFDPDIEQLHVDGNKSLIFGMVNFSLKGEDKTFETEGRVGYLEEQGLHQGKDATRTHHRPSGPSSSPQDRHQERDAQRVERPHVPVQGQDVRTEDQDLQRRARGEPHLRDLAGEPIVRARGCLPREKRRQGLGEPGRVGNVNNYFLQGAGYSANGQGPSRQPPDAVDSGEFDSPRPLPPSRSTWTSTSRKEKALGRSRPASLQGDDDEVLEGPQEVLEPKVEGVS